MTEIETLIRAQLDRRYPVPDREPDWPDVLERLSATKRPRRRLRPRAAVALALGVAAAVAAVVLAAPWRGGPSFTEQALAAVGHGRYVHAFIRSPNPYSFIVDLRTGRARHPVDGVEVVYDAKTGTYDARLIGNGVASFKAHGSVRAAISLAPRQEVGFPVDPVLTAFASGYRNALKRGQARIVGETTVDGRNAKIVRVPFVIRHRAVRSGPALKDTFYEEVAVATDSYKPLWIRPTYQQVDPRTHRPIDRFMPRRCPCLRVASIGSSDRRPSLPAVVKRGPVLGGEAVDIRRFDPADARAAFGRTPLWVGRTFGRVTLRKVRLQRLVHWPASSGVARVIYAHVPKKGPLGLRLDYRGGRASLKIEQSARPEPGYGLGPGLAPPGNAWLSCSDPCDGNWSAILRKDGLFVRIQAHSRRLASEAARALTPMPSR